MRPRRCNQATGGPSVRCRPPLHFLIGSVAMARSARNPRRRAAAAKAAGGRAKSAGGKARRAAGRKPIDLYYWPIPNGFKISIMLEECGLPYTMIPVNIARGDQFKPEFL